MLTEKQLIERISRGDESAFRAIFERYHSKIYGFAFSLLKNKEESEEIIQEIFLQLWLHRGRLDTQKSIASFLFVTARRLIIDGWRKKTQLKRYTVYMKQMENDARCETENNLFAKEVEDAAQIVLKRLSGQQHQVFRLSRYEGKSYDEIAEQLNISTHTVKYHLVNVLKIMRMYFNKNDLLYTFMAASFLYLLATAQ